MLNFVRILTFFLALGLSFIPRPAEAQEVVAQQSAEEILRAFAAGQFKDVWSQKVSKFMKDRVTEDFFLSSMAVGRPQLGKLQSLRIVSTQHFDKDPGSGFVGDIYIVVFRSAYSVGEFYENVTVLKEADGKYRLSGLYGAPVPK